MSCNLLIFNFLTPFGPAGVTEVGVAAQGSAAVIAKAGCLGGRSGLPGRLFGRGGCFLPGLAFAGNGLFCGWFSDEEIAKLVFLCKS